MSKVFGPYSPIRQAGHMYFIAGQIGVDPLTQKVSKHIEAQTRQTLINLRELLLVSKLSINHIIKTTVYLKNMNDFAAMNAIYLDFFENPRPARACIEVAGLPKVAPEELLIEIEAVAYKP